MAKQILFDDQARQKMRAGIEKLARTVRCTMGPGGGPGPGLIVS